MEDHDETKSIGDMSELDKGDDNKTRNNNDNKTHNNNDNKKNNINGMYLSAASIFNILHNAIGDGQNTIHLERKYLSGKPEFNDRILIDEKDVKLIEEWSDKYEIISPKTKHLHKILSSLGRKRVDQEYHQRVVEWMFDCLEELKSKGDIGFEGGQEEYETCIKRLAVLTLKLARCDLTSGGDFGETKSV